MAGAKRKSTRSPLLRKGSSFSHGIEMPGAARGTKRKASPATIATVSKKSKVSSKVAVATKIDSPYSAFPRPSASDVTQLHVALAKQFGERKPSGKRAKRGKILDTVVGTILSQNTTNINSHRAFLKLKKRFPSWDQVMKAKPSAIEAEIRCAGLAPKKTPWILNILKTLHKERGVTSMEYLRKESKERVHSELERFTGVGKKTSAIINLFDIGHPDMAVDTHVFRYALQLGWAPTDKERAAHNRKAEHSKKWPVVTRDTVYAHIDNRFPDKLKYSMHLIMTDTEGGLPVVCGSTKKLSFKGKKVLVDGKPCPRIPH